MSQEMFNQQPTNNKVEIKAKAQVIYFEDENEQLGKHYHFNNERLKLSEAGQVLKDNNVPYETVLRVMSENVVIELDASTLSQSIKK